MMNCEITYFSQLFYLTHKTQMSNQSSRISLHTPLKFTYSSEKNLEETLDGRTIKSKLSDIPTMDMSLFSTTHSLKRVNQIQPKQKIVIPKRHRTQIVTSSSAQSQYTNSKKQSLDYDSIKSSIFQWKKFTPMCGFQPKTGQNGCLCGNPCQFIKQWTKNYKESDYKLYQQLLNQKVKAQQQTQINKDITRTHSQCLTFTNNLRFQQMLRQVLRQYSIYDPQVGYVQGMNLIVGAILYHIKNSQLTFWAFVDLMDQQQLRMIYLPGFSYLRMHQEKILKIMDEKVHDLVQKMNILGIQPSSFLHGWILTLMTVCVPLEYTHLIIKNFRKQGWKYIYQLVITYLVFLKESLLKAEEETDFLLYLDLKSSREYGKVWEELINNASNFPLEPNSAQKSKKY